MYLHISKVFWRVTDLWMYNPVPTGPTHFLIRILGLGGLRSKLTHTGFAMRDNSIEIEIKTEQR
jgi:hypothetical protein